MKTTELRIGNLVECNGKIETISGVIQYGVYFGFVYCPNVKDFFQPIQITEDWLIKFGFELNNTGFYNKGRLTFHPFHGWKIINVWVKEWVGIAEIKYVHQLQNLYFALTGEEL